MLGDEVILTQYGNGDDAGRRGYSVAGFRNRPRSSEAAISVLAGTLSVDQITLIVQRRDARRGDRSRSTSAGTMREAGFDVEATPSQRIRIHVSVSFSSDWTDAVALRFDDCFEVTDDSG